LRGTAPDAASFPANLSGHGTSESAPPAPIVLADAMQDSVGRVIEASFQRRSDPEVTCREREGQIPLRRFATPEEIAAPSSSSHRPSPRTSAGQPSPAVGGYTAF
jgi:hypothetical protein